MAGFLETLRSVFGRDVAPNGQEIVWQESMIPLIEGMTPEELYRTQPYLRLVVDFVARNIAHLGVHVYERVSDTDRRRVKDDPVAQLLRAPNPTMTTYELITALVSDLKLHDIAYWMVGPSSTSRSGWEIWPVPPSWVVKRKGGNLWQPAEYHVLNPKQRTPVVVPVDNMLVFHGWNPADPSRGQSPVEALRGLLIEQISAQTYRTQVWQRGGRVGTYITRPAGAPPWGKDDKEKFIRQWNAKYSGNNGPQAGSTPLLGDGMEVKQTRFTAKEEEWAEVAKLSLATVASVYHVNPTMVGLLDNANFSNVREFRRMLYGDTLGPDIAMIEDRINAYLVPRVANNPDIYVEFNIAEKLQGSFEEQAQHLQAAVGGPWMTRSEARALQNLPAIDGADELIVPLNVIEGGQASPQDSAPKSTPDLETITNIITTALAASKGDAVDGKKGAAAVKDEAEDVEVEGEQEKIEDLADVLVKFFARQARVIKTALGAKARDAEWWDAERWDAELADDLFAAAQAITAQVGVETAQELGYTAGDYDVARTLEFLKAVAASRASMINQTTFDQITARVEDDGQDIDKAVDETFKEAEDVRAPESSQTLLTTFVSFAAIEAAKQISQDTATKTWRTRSSNPRTSHARMNGETVPIDEVFSNGMNWPGDPAGGPDEVAGCKCTVTVNVP